MEGSNEKHHHVKNTFTDNRQSRLVTLRIHHIETAKVLVQAVHNPNSAQESNDIGFHCKL